MSMYVVQVKPGTDLQVAVLLRKNGHLVRCPQRTMDIRKNGKWNSITEPVFPGYLFLEEEIDRQKYDSVVQSDGVIGFLKVSGCTLGKLQPHEEAYIRWLWNGGKLIAPSRIYTTLQGDKMVLSGVLREYWNNVVRLDLRQRRARVRLSICGHDYTVTLPVIGI